MKEILSKRKIFYIYLICFFSGVCFLTSCSVSRIAYFKDLPDSIKSAKSYATVPFTAPLIQPDDIMNIMIQTLDPNANHILNESNLTILSGAAAGGAGGGAAVQNAVSGYLVSPDGFIHMQFIGDVKIGGLTTEQARDTILDKISQFYKNSVVVVRFSNFRVTILGEVHNPGTFLIPNERPSLLEAIGLAGDIDIWGRRDNVMLIRDVNGTKQIARLDLDSVKSISSPYFYLRPNDVIYVESSPSRVQSTDAFRLRDIAIVGAALSLLTVILSRLIR
jgi:polysaccharide export outer membrane protein